MANQSAQLDHVFKALSDPTRRAVLRRLSRGPAAVSELAKPFEMALPSFMQHLDALEGWGLVKSKKEGRVRTYQISPKPMKAAEDWMIEQRSIWEQRLNRLDSFLLELKDKEKK